MKDGKITIGVMAGNANSAHTTETLRGIYDAGRKYGVNLLFFVGAHSSYFSKNYFEKQNVEDYDYQSSCVFEYSKLCDVDVILASHGTLSLFLNDREQEAFSKTISGKPVIYLETRIESDDSRYIIVDNYRGIMQLMEHLTTVHGYHNILHLAGRKGTVEADERRQAYMDAMAAIGQEVTDTMVEYGDFSESVHDQVNALLDNNPDAEAIVCANDVMAVTAYEVISKREELYRAAKATGDQAMMARYKKHKIGRASEYSIAVCGFDNSPAAANVDPPITTVAQSPYSIGYMGVKSAMGMIMDPAAVRSIMAPPKLILRESCGCRVKKRLEFPAMNDYYRDRPDEFAREVSEIYTNGLLPVEINEAVRRRVYDTVYKIIYINCRDFLGLSGDDFSGAQLLEDCRDFINGEASEYIPRVTFIAAFNDFMMSLIKNAKDGRQKETLFEAVTKMNDYVYAKLFDETREEQEIYKNRTWFMPHISRDMANNADNPKVMYADAMSKLSVLGIGDVYMFLLENAIEHNRGEDWVCPDELRLAASCVNGKVSSYDLSEAPVVTKQSLITDYIAPGDESGSYVLYNLYAGKRHYGVIVAKCTAEDMLSVYYVTVHIATALKYCEAANAQKKAQAELEKIISEVEDKNEILRSLSEYDQLTGCYNRRGFFEKGIELIKNNNGRKACLVFADLDHLKEINDKYGHSEGDYAIETVARTIKRALPDDTITARLGGDEFVAMFLLSDDDNVEELMKNIPEIAKEYNSLSVKPFYVECSAGYSVFTCDNDVRLEDVMSRADESLYAEKKKRRDTIVKKMSVL